MKFGLQADLRRLRRLGELSSNLLLRPTRSQGPGRAASL